MIKHFSSGKYSKKPTLSKENVGFFIIYYTLQKILYLNYQI